MKAKISKGKTAVAFICYGELKYPGTGLWEQGKISLNFDLFLLDHPSLSLYIAISILDRIRIEG